MCAICVEIETVMNLPELILDYAAEYMTIISYVMLCYQIPVYPC